MALLGFADLQLVLFIYRLDLLNYCSLIGSINGDQLYFETILNHS